jgi:hypothetical protein
MEGMSDAPIVSSDLERRLSERSIVVDIHNALLSVGDVTKLKRRMPCLGIKRNPIKISVIEAQNNFRKFLYDDGSVNEAQNNFRKFLNDDGSVNEYCHVLKGIINNKENIIRSDGLRGYYFLKIIPKIKIHGVY